jgi:origin recognition complex subunit 6
MILQANLLSTNRLKQYLNLPKIEPRPPCPPRIYNKLYSYLDGLLVVKKRGRPPKKASAASTPAKSLPSRPTPTKTSSLAPFKTTPGRTAGSRRRGLQFVNTAKDVAPWIHPVIRGLCKCLSAPAAAPHILAGVTTILTLPSPLSNGQDGTKDDKKDKVPALIAAVYFFVCTRLSGRETSGKEYVTQRKGVLNTLTQLREDEQLAEKLRDKGDGSTDWEGWQTVGTKDVDAWLLEISTKGWLQLDWFENIIEGAGLNVKDGITQFTDGPVSESHERSGAINGDKSLMRTGLGTMMQDRVDYLSEQKREEYRIWKEGIMLRIEDMEVKEIRGFMDTS